MPGGHRPGLGGRRPIVCHGQRDALAAQDKDRPAAQKAWPSGGRRAAPTVVVAAQPLGHLVQLPHDAVDVVQLDRISEADLAELVEEAWLARAPARLAREFVAGRGTTYAMPALAVTMISCPSRCALTPRDARHSRSSSSCGAPVGASTRSRTLPLTWQTSSNVSVTSISGSA